MASQRISHRTIDEKVHQICRDQLGYSAGRTANGWGPAPSCSELSNRAEAPRFSAVGYQESGGLIVNSPIEAPSLAEKVRNDWGNADVETLRQSLLEDIRATNQPKRISRADYIPRFVSPALARLRFYFPTTYGALETQVCSHSVRLHEPHSSSLAMIRRGGVYRRQKCPLPPPHPILTLARAPHSGRAKGLSACYASVLV